MNEADSDAGRLGGAASFSRALVGGPHQGLGLEPAERPATHRWA